jgi:predicted O-methyltransferase YrrM
MLGMDKEQWKAVDRYLAEMLLESDPVLESALEESAAAGLPSINVSAVQGKLLHLLARSCGAKSILEIGTLGGYSAIWLARALPSDGRLVTLEYEQKHAQVAQNNLARAGLSGVVELMLGRAIDLLPKLLGDSRAPFDFIFIDADKQSTAEYFEWSLKLSHSGSIIVVDNVVRSGAVIDAASNDESVKGIRRFLERVSQEPRVTATAIQTVGSKGYDGFVMAVVK